MVNVKSIFLVVVCLIILIYAIAVFHPDLTNTLEKIAPDNHLIISKDQAISIAEDQWDFRNQSPVTIDQQNAILTFGLNSYFIPMLEWYVQIHGNNATGLNAGGEMLIEAFTGKVVWNSPYR